MAFHSGNCSIIQSENSLGAFTFASNIASIRVLEKNGFTRREEFEEDGILSCYLQVECTEGYKGVIK